MKKYVVMGCALLVLGTAAAALMKGSKHDHSYAAQENIVSESGPVEARDQINRIPLFFVRNTGRLPIVDTIKYSSRVPWMKGNAWIADYASHHNTSRHFIARSLNGGRPDYETQTVSHGDTFNVFKEDANIEFYLLVDLSRCKMRFYYVDIDTDERVLLKTYPVGLGRFDQYSPSGLLTPTGKYLIGEKVASYRPGKVGTFQDQEIEMIHVFGTRWIPFADEIEDCSAPARGFGLHGAPWNKDPETGEYYEDRESVGVYGSDGCVRLVKEDVEELYSILISKKTVIELVGAEEEAVKPGHASTLYPETT